MNRDAIRGALPWARIAISAIIGLAVTLICVFVTAYLMQSDRIPAGAIALCGYGSAFFGGLVGSVLSAGKTRKLLSAALCVALIGALLFLLGCLLVPGAFQLKTFVWVLIILLVSCMIGSVISGFLSR